MSHSLPFELIPGEFYKSMEGKKYRFIYKFPVENYEEFNYPHSLTKNYPLLFSDLPGGLFSASLDGDILGGSDKIIGPWEEPKPKLVLEEGKFYRTNSLCDSWKKIQILQFFNAAKKMLIESKNGATGIYKIGSDLRSFEIIEEWRD